MSSLSTNADTRSPSAHYGTTSPLLGQLPDPAQQQRLKYNPERLKKRLKCCTVTLFVLAIVFGIVSIGLAASMPGINMGVNEYIAWRLSFLPGSITIQQMSSPTEPVAFKLNMFNLTNPDEFMKGAKPHYTEIGPFYYDENGTMFDLIWNEDQTRVSYNKCTTYTYNRDKSHGLDPVNINITTINLPLVGLLVQFTKLQDLVSSLTHNNSLAKQLLNDIIKGFDEALRNEIKENLIITKPIDKFLWGYTDPFLKFIEDLHLTIPGIDLPPNGEFVLLQRSAYYPKRTMIYTGKGDYKRSASYVLWEGLAGIDGWGTPEAGMINGTQAIFFHPNIQYGEDLVTFVHELRRSITLSFTEKVELYGIKLYQYRLLPEALWANKSDPGFYMNGPDGVFNVSHFYPLNIPVYMSKPHFLDGPAYLEYIEGLVPNRTKHDTVLGVEPITGAVLNGLKRLQVNVQLKQNPDYDELSKLPKVTYFPVFWIEEGGVLDSKGAEDFKKEVYVPLNYIHGSVEGVASVTGFVAIVSCLLLLLIGISKCEKRCRANNKENVPIY